MKYIKVLLFFISWVMYGCSTTEVVTTHIVPVMSKPTLPQEPIAPNLHDQLPELVTLTSVETNYYAEVCAAWESGEYTEEEMSVNYPGLTRGAACDWVIKGYTIQDSLTVEDMWNQSAIYAEGMRIYSEVLRQQIDNMYKSGMDTEEAIKKLNEKPPVKETKSWFNF